MLLPLLPKSLRKVAHRQNLWCLKSAPNHAGLALQVRLSRHEKRLSVNGYVLVALFMMLIFFNKSLQGSPIPNGLPGKYLSSANTLSTSETHSACARTSLPPSKVHSATNSTQCIISTPDPYKERARKTASLSFGDQLDLNSASSTRSKPASRPKSMVSRLPIRVK